MTLTVLRSRGQVFCRYAFFWICFFFFKLMVKLWVGGGPQRRSAILITSWQGCALSTWFIAVHAGFGHLVKAVLVKFLPCKDAVPPTPFSHCNFWKAVTRNSPHLRTPELRFPSLKAEYLCSLLETALRERFVSYPFVLVCPMVITKSH